ncbi:MAG: rhomboid family intramembrane serine protease [Nannocystaceae bacterium]|nr:rhomboid family intramembrane serine protease [Myxococcales bacterium]
MNDRHALQGRPRADGIGPELAATVFTLAAVLGSMWATELVDQYLLGGKLDGFGVRPHDVHSLGGIFAAPFLHSGFAHLTSNTVGLAILGTLLLLWSRREFWKVSIAATIVAGLGTWLLGHPNSVHIGASGVLFGYFGYLLLRGIFERKLGAILISLVVGWFFGSMAHGMFPGLAGSGISWEMHFFGFLGGALVAWTWRRRSRRAR